MPLIGMEAYRSHAPAAQRPYRISAVMTAYLVMTADAVARDE
jgi:hypothetical protein